MTKAGVTIANVWPYGPSGGRGAWVHLLAIMMCLVSAEVRADAATECILEGSESQEARACQQIKSDAKLDPLERGRTYTLRGFAWMKEEEPAAAVSDFSRAIALDATNISAIRGRAQAYAAMGKYNLSVADWTSIIALNPQDEAYFRERGATNLAAGNHEAALADYAKALEIKPKNAAAYVGRAAVHDVMKDRAKALKDFSDALSINPSYVPAYWERALMAERWGEKTLAIENYMKLLEYNGVFWDARKALQKHGIYNWPNR